MTVSVYEQLKDDLGYLQLGRAAEVFATLAEQARAEDWTHRFDHDLVAGADGEEHLRCGG